MNSKEALKRLRQETAPATYMPDFDKNECCDIIERDLLILEKIKQEFPKLEKITRENFDGKLPIGVLIAWGIEWEIYELREKVMTSKEALQKMSNYIARLGGGETLEEEEIIIRDLEVLKILEKYYKFMIYYKNDEMLTLMAKDLEEENASVLLTKEEHDKIKFWLKEKDNADR